MIIKEHTEYRIEEGGLRINLTVNYDKTGAIKSVDLSPKGGGGFNFLNSDPKTVDSIVNMMKNAMAFVMSKKHFWNSGFPRGPHLPPEAFNPFTQDTSKAPKEIIDGNQ